MKRLTAWVAAGLICTTAAAQDEAGKTSTKSDTIRIGGIVIVKKGENKKVKEISVGNAPVPSRNKKVTTNWGVVDIGFSNYFDKTDYSATGSYLVNKPGSPALGKSDFKLRDGKSINVNIWFFTQQVSLYKRYFNLKYGLGIELNNYRYKSSVSYREAGQLPYAPAGTVTNAPFVFRDSISFKKNKLAADYLTVPLMLNVNTNPNHRRRSFSMSAGVSIGYLYSQRNKQRSAERGKWKNKGDYDLEKFKFAYQAEIGFGQVHLYGTYSPKSIYKNGPDMRPYTIGLRFSN